MGRGRDGGGSGWGGEGSHLVAICGGWMRQKIKGDKGGRYVDYNYDHDGDDEDDDDYDEDDHK